MFVHFYHKLQKLILYFVYFCTNMNIVLVCMLIGFFINYNIKDQLIVVLCLQEVHHANTPMYFSPTRILLSYNVYKNLDLQGYTLFFIGYAQISLFS